MSVRGRPDWYLPCLRLVDTVSVSDIHLLWTWTRAQLLRFLRTPAELDKRLYALGVGTEAAWDALMEFVVRESGSAHSWRAIKAQKRSADLAASDWACSRSVTVEVAFTPTKTEQDAWWTRLFNGELGKTQLPEPSSEERAERAERERTKQKELERVRREKQEAFRQQALARGAVVASRQSTKSGRTVALSNCVV